jgi:hypothetical protein
LDIDVFTMWPNNLDKLLAKVARPLLFSLHKA